MILVVNADDAGVDVPRNRGIVRAAREGIVRSASLLVNGEAAEDFASRAREAPGLTVGLHLNFTEGRPLTRGLRSLVGQDGAFVGKRELFRRAMEGLIAAREAQREARAQWRRAEELGFRPTHVDGHNHAHLLPGIAEAVAEIVPPRTWVRAWRESPGDTTPAIEPVLYETNPYADGPTIAGWLRRLSRRALGLGWSKFRLADHFEGLMLPSGYGATDLLGLLERLAPGEARVVELMTHPGEMCEGSVPFSASPDRAREVEALGDERVLCFAREAGFRLAGFGSREVDEASP